MYNLAALASEESRTDEQQIILRLDFYAESIVRTTCDAGRPVAYDEILPDDLGRALAGLSFSTGLLPRDTLFYQGSGDCRIGIYLPPAVRTLWLDGEKTPLQVPLPPLVFVGQGDSYHIYALSRMNPAGLANVDWPSAATVLYRAPFPNVHADGTICRGSVEFPTCGAATIHHAAGLFFESQFNKDLANDKSQRYPRDVVDLWRALAPHPPAGLGGSEEYPLKDLVEMGMTVGDLSLKDG
jgi:PRTRC genetic system protein B